jgi:hypothetical protein
MIMRTLRLLALLLFAMPAFANLVINGSFDNTCNGWALALTDGFTCSATEGNPGFALILNNGPGLVPQASQTIAGLIAGDIYQITIDAKTHYNCCNSATTPGAGVGIDGQQFDFLIVNNQPWTTYTFDFTYGGGSNVFVISAQRNGTDSDGEFDNVAINLVQSGAPEPGTLMMLGAGVVSILVSRLRRR